MAFIQSRHPVIMQPLANALLAALSGRPLLALLTTPTLHLFTVGPMPIGPITAKTQFTEASFSGYVAVALGTLLGPINLPGTGGYGVHVEGDFLAGAISGSGQNIAGYWIDDNVSTVYMAETFASPVPIATAGDFISLDVIFSVAVFNTTS